eukprot:364759-Chlamydomonas_euryale.AAC.27
MSAAPVEASRRRGAGQRTGAVAPSAASILIHSAPFLSSHPPCAPVACTYCRRSAARLSSPSHLIPPARRAPRDLAHGTDRVAPRPATYGGWRRDPAGGAGCAAPAPEQRCVLCRCRVSGGQIQAASLPCIAWASVPHRPTLPPDAPTAGKIRAANALQGDPPGAQAAPAGDASVLQSTGRGLWGNVGGWAMRWVAERTLPTSCDCTA